MHELTHALMQRNFRKTRPEVHTAGKAAAPVLSCFSDVGTIDTTSNRPGKRNASSVATCVGSLPPTASGRRGPKQRGAVTRHCNQHSATRSSVATCVGSLPPTASGRRDPKEP
eukprot:CAMPEP_0117462180 /NCGR_PEP_ID=MMETSP0784-20121206/2919_1 /TAXON_ID=39447 /ORGANISM="" /LENGTH=112 /DNA_ID=CAMNT_0005255933 /DNA_START=20 /DNA_END=358 /DNA_ORIENTATION=-